ncbi:hypothetical protein PTSG_04746 [Salpingoeca rosetta]|uniref:EXPERA domain-containing protein n=1 Tax=Salpingoeca rosetta (strain ATCC 50818 / BSB-021) TaxID=946362 RepID=F2U9K8_SALR5|nr:uncharacterized protein PTSG_04746 [Salpingoeca rosetta]EGD73035.1 hypothetical protein PTSG_04746 [Salpingoeca rosetta]|eukprot:XP_004994066.1 hypothetical protein PTSG_04746 [Salpingoeca rosetta]
MSSNAVQYLARRRSPIRYTSRSLRSPTPPPAPDFDAGDDESPASPGVEAPIADTEQAKSMAPATEEEVNRRALAIAGKVAALTLLAVPVCYLFDFFGENLSGFGTFLFGLTILIGFPMGLRDMFSVIPDHDMFMYFFSVFAFTSAIDFILAFTIDKRNAVLVDYLERGEPYLSTAYGFAANLWDGTAHWLLYIIMIFGLASHNPALYRSYYLYWIGSITFSLCKLMPGAAIGHFSHAMDYSAFLNVPFILLPVYFLKRVIDTPRPIEPAKRGTAWMEAAFAALLSVAVIVLGIRFAAANNSDLPIAAAWREVEPTLDDPSRFFAVTSMVHLYYAVPMMSVLIVTMLFGASRTQRGFCSDVAVLLAGGMGESQFCYMVSAFHHLTPDNLRVSPDSCGFWGINVGLVVLTHAIAVYLTSRRGLAGIFK